MLLRARDCDLSVWDLNDRYLTRYFISPSMKAISVPYL